MKQLPNIITISRILVIPFIIYFLVSGDYRLSFWLFVWAGLSDGLDGMIARMCSMRTKLGAFLDPLADKIMIVGMFAAFWGLGLVPLWLFLLVIGRDVMIIAGVIIVHKKSYPLEFEPIFLSKINTALTIVFVAGMVGALAFDLSWLFHWLDYALYVVMFTTIISAIGYLKRAWALYCYQNKDPLKD